MLRMVPGVSNKKAIRVTEVYPSFQTLYEAFNDESVDEDSRKELLAVLLTFPSFFCLSKLIVKFTIIRI